MAKRKAEELARAFRLNGRSEAPELTIGALLDSYQEQVTPTKGASARQHDKRALEMMRRYFGAQRRVASLDRRDWDGGSFATGVPAGFGPPA